MLQSFDFIAAITVAGILGILVLYIVIVCKKGWLKQESKACPRNTVRVIVNGHFL